MLRVLYVVLAASVLQGCASHTGRPCEDNFTTTGSFLSGKQFTTYAVLPGTPPDLAMGNAYKMLAREGFHVESANEKARVITAYQNVNFSTKTAPINVMIEPAGGGSQVTLTFVAAAGLYTPESGAKSQFCKYMDEVGR